jgi:hypothetical protein
MQSYQHHLETFTFCYPAPKSFGLGYVFKRFYLLLWEVVQQELQSLSDHIQKDQRLVSLLISL